MNLIKKKVLFQKIFDLFFYVALIFIVVVFLGLSIFQSQDKSFMGYRMFGVLSNSMAMPSGKTENGGFKAGSVIFVQDAKAEQLKIGDIITYRPSVNPNNKSTNFLTHRLVEIQSDVEDGPYYVTKGDGNKDTDMPIVPKAIVGKVVFSIPGLGSLLKFIRDNKITSVVFVVSIIAFFLTLRMYVFPAKKETSSKKKKTNARRRPNSQQAIRTNQQNSQKNDRNVQRRRRKKSPTNQVKRRINNN
ncbi:signal peptidase I [Enterococcus sp. LJL99]